MLSLVRTKTIPPGSTTVTVDAKCTAAPCTNRNKARSGAGRKAKGGRGEEEGEEEDLGILSVLLVLLAVWGVVARGVGCRRRRRKCPWRKEKGKAQRETVLSSALSPWLGLQLSCMGE